MRNALTSMASRAIAAKGRAPAAPFMMIQHAFYHENVVDHYNNPRNVGSFDKNDPNVGTGLVGAPACGDVMKLQIRVDPETGKIVDSCFKTFGCGSAIASSSVGFNISFAPLNSGGLFVAGSGEESPLMDGYREGGSSSQNRQPIPILHEVGENSSEAEKAFRMHLVNDVTLFKHFMENPRFIEFLQSPLMAQQVQEHPPLSGHIEAQFQVSIVSRKGKEHSHATTEWIKGKPMDEVLTIRNSDIAKHLALPPVKLHCSMLAEDAIKAAVKDLKTKNVENGSTKKDAAEAKA
ncbi:hypothetical protein L7F22_007387 [Adiantum nelumboides]|nr:hypothetical protein [Adiantum nelumboides]